MKTTAFQVTIPAVALLGGMVFMTSCADKIGTAGQQTEEISINVVSSHSTRTAFDDNGRTTLWSASDVLYVYDEDGNSSTFTAIPEEGVQYAEQMKFSCKTWTKGKTPTWAIYAGGSSAPSLDATGGSFTVVIPEVQTAAQDGSFGEGAAPAAGRAVPYEGGGYSVEMKNLCGLVRFELANAQPELAAISLTDSDGEYIGGEIDVVWSNDVPVCSVVPEHGRKSITFRRGVNGTLGDGTYYICVAGEMGISPVITFTLSNGKQASYRHTEKVKIARNGITDLGIIDGTIEFDKPYVLTFDFLNWNECIAFPGSGAIDAKAKVTEFYGKGGKLLESSAPLGRSSAYGLYSYSEIVAGSTLSLPAVPAMKLVKVEADMGGMPSKGYPNNSGAPCIATADGNIVKGGEAATDYGFVIPEQGNDEPDSDPYIWNLSGTETETAHCMKFTESAQSFGLQSLRLYYAGAEEPEDINSIMTEDGDSPAVRKMTMNGSFTTTGGMYNDTFCGFRYKEEGSEWKYVAVNEHNGGRFSTTIEVPASGDYIYNAYASIGDKSELRRYGSPKSVHVAGESVTLAAIDFTTAEIPEQSAATAGETTVSGSDGYTYRISGQVFDGKGSVTYYRHATEKSLYFARMNNGGTVDNNACGFIELPAPDGCTLRSIKIADHKSAKTYRVYGEKKALYDAEDKEHLGSVLNVKADGSVTLNVKGAEAGKTYYLCCPIFTYVDSIEVTYEK